MSAPTVFRLALVALALLGLWILVQSPTMGASSADAYLSSQGGSMSTDLFVTLRTAYMESYRLLGSLLLGIGLFRLTASGRTPRT